MFVSSQGRFWTDGGSHLATTCPTRLGFACSHFTRNKGLGALGPWDILRCLQCFGCLVSHLSCESPLAALDVSYPKDVAWSLLETRHRIAWNLPACIILLYRLPIIVKNNRANALDVLSKKNQRFPMFSHVFFHVFPRSCIHEIAVSGLVLVVVVGQVWVLQMMLIGTNYISIVEQSFARCLSQRCATTFRVSCCQLVSTCLRSVWGDCGVLPRTRPPTSNTNFIQMSFMQDVNVIILII